MSKSSKNTAMTTTTDVEIDEIIVKALSRRTLFIAIRRLSPMMAALTRIGSRRDKNRGVLGNTRMSMLRDVH
jgi:hypothetical protein